MFIGLFSLLIEEPRISGSSILKISIWTRKETNRNSRKQRLFQRNKLVVSECELLWDCLLHVEIVSKKIRSTFVAVDFSIRQFDSTNLQRRESNWISFSKWVFSPISVIRKHRTSEFSFCRCVWKAAKLTGTNWNKDRTAFNKISRPKSKNRLRIEESAKNPSFLTSREKCRWKWKLSSSFARWRRSEQIRR